MKIHALIGVGLVAFTVSALGLYLADQPLPSGVLAGSSPVGAGVSAWQEALQADFEEQRLAYGELGREVARLESRIDLLSESLSNSPRGDTPASAEDPTAIALDGSVQSAMAVGAEQVGLEEATRPLERREQQRQRLLAAGFSAQETDEIIRVVDENTLQRLALRYQAARGGDAARSYRAELRALPNSRELVREQFGEGAYDQYLYATGQPNRVVVTGVLERSAAQEAGLRAGDTLLLLDDQPVYALGDLIRISARGSEFERVPLQVLREGELIEVSVPRGPLGINASPESINPG
jgi:C-terminal processing protease CtpA/Prc